MNKKELLIKKLEYMRSELGDIYAPNPAVELALDEAANKLADAIILLKQLRG